MKVAAEAETERGGEGETAGAGGAPRATAALRTKGRSARRVARVGEGRRMSGRKGGRGGDRDLLEEAAVAEPFGEAYVPCRYGEVRAIGADAETVAAAVVDVELGVDAGCAERGEKGGELVGHAVVVGAGEEGGWRGCFRP